MRAPYTSLSHQAKWPLPCAGKLTREKLSKQFRSTPPGQEAAGSGPGRGLSWRRKEQMGHVGNVDETAARSGMDMTPMAVSGDGNPRTRRRPGFSLENGSDSLNKVSVLSIIILVGKS